MTGPDGFSRYCDLIQTPAYEAYGVALLLSEYFKHLQPGNEGLTGDQAEMVWLASQALATLTRIVYDGCGATGPQDFESFRAGAR